jgi:aminoglycoside phosphotransferase (APT) family kinase protein
MAELEHAPGSVPIPIHSDIWPPNVISRDGHVVGIIDFDDMAVGPMQLELAAVLTEFCFIDLIELDELRTQSVLRGFVNGGGRIQPGHHRLLVSGIEASCASWIGANVLHGVTFDDSLSLVRRLDGLRTERARQDLADRLEALYRRAAAAQTRSEVEHERLVEG